MRFSQLLGLALAAASRINALSQISVSGRMSITDDEVFGDEHATRTKTFEPVFIGSPGPAQGSLSWREGMGGEVRIEVYLTFTLQPGDQSVKVNYNVKLYEGTSENSDDLDGQENGSATIRADGTSDINIRVRNTDEGGDFADIVLSVINDKL